MSTASCQCGSLSVTASEPPDFTVACNCRACQKRTGGVFGVGAYFRKSTLSITGDRVAYPRIAESGRALEQNFCPKCGSTVFWSLEMRPDHMGVAVGCFDGDAPTPVRAIWTSEAHDWVSFPPEWPTYETGSPS